MNIIFSILLVLQILICPLLIGIVLIQRSKGQGVGLSFGGGAEAIFGAHMGNVLTRFTVILGIVFLVNTAVLAILRPTSGSSGSVMDQASKPAAAAEIPTATLPTVEDDEALLNVLGGPVVDMPVVVTEEPVVEIAPVASDEEETDEE